MLAHERGHREGGGRGGGGGWRMADSGWMNSKTDIICMQIIGNEPSNNIKLD